MSTLSRTIAPLVLMASFVLPAGAQSGSFGNAVVFAGDDLIIAEPNTTFREGSVYVYRQGGDEWHETHRLTAPDAERADGFGSALAYSDGSLFIGQRGGPIHVFARDGLSWSSTGVIDGEGTAGVDPGCGQYGYCGTDFGLELAAGSGWLFVGAPGQPASAGSSESDGELAAGAVHVYRSQGDTWEYSGRLAPEDGTAGDRFGAVIAFHGEELLVSAPDWNDGATETEGVGRVLIYALDADEWARAGELSFRSESNANFGAAIATHGSSVFVGAPGWDEGRGLVQRFEGGEVREATSLAPGEGDDRFGAALGVHDGTLWVGAPAPREYEVGSTYVYALDASGAVSGYPWHIALEETVERDHFGGKIVAGEQVVTVAAPGMHHQSGSVHVYDTASGSPSGGQMLVGPPDALGAILGDRKPCVDGKIGMFDCDEVELHAFIPNSMLREGDWARGVRTNDNWGWTDPTTGREYALVGRNDGTSFIDITEPSNPALIGDLPKPWGTPPSQLWRDIKTYKGYAFIVADGAGDHGMQVFDLGRLRKVTNPPAMFEPDVHYRQIASSHNIVINEDTGFAYAVGNRGGGESCGGGLHMIDIRDPLNPTFVGCAVGERGTHDSQCVLYHGPDERYHGHELCLNSNGSYFEISDVTDKDNPIVLSTASSPNAGYIHQGWLTDDHRHFYQDDEADVVRGDVETTRTLVWDLSDIEDPILVTEFMGSLPASAHNLYLEDGHAYQANYRYGMHVLDVSDPENPVEVGKFDTSPYQDGPGFSGAWSTFPFYESDLVLVTSLQEGLFVLKRMQREF